MLVVVEEIGAHCQARTTTMHNHLWLSMCLSHLQSISDWRCFTIDQQYKEMFVDDVKGCLKTGSGPVKYDDLIDKPCYYKPKYDAFRFYGVLTEHSRYVGSDGTVYIQLETGKLPAYSELSDYVFWANGEEYNAKDVAIIPNGEDGSIRYNLGIGFTVILQRYTIADNLTLHPGAYYILWTDTVPSETQEFRLYKPGSVKKISPSVLPSLYGKVVLDTIPIKAVPSDVESEEALSAWLKNNYETIPSSKYLSFVKLSDTVLSIDDLVDARVLMGASDTHMDPADVIVVINDDFPKPVVSFSGILLWAQEDMDVDGYMMTKGLWTMADSLSFMSSDITIYKNIKLPNNLLEMPIPTIPDTTKNYVLKSIAGALTWVEETTEAPSST